MSEIDQLPPLREIIKQYELSAKKALGQNFLLDMNLTDKIVRSAGDLSNKTVFEIGPGPGGLTRSLLKSGAKKVIAVEYDERAVKALGSLEEAAQGRLEVINKDAMELDLLSLAPDGERAIVANLPYNIATPLLIGWLHQIRQIPDAFDSMTLMFQKEVAERIVSGSGNKTYGRLAIISQWLCRANCMFDIAPSAFTPPPKVKSTVVHFVPRGLPDIAPAFASVEKVTALAFGQRRKMLRSSLKEYQNILDDCDIDATLRAENLSVEDFVRIAGQLI